jgi:ribosomal protein L11 methyltransferase
LAVYARQASGSGYQPATQLALEALEKHLHQGDRFLDVGAGSGILSAAAELLGAGPRFACDIDLEALAEARENLTPAHLFGGSPRSIAADSMDLVAANLNAEALLNLQSDLLRVLAPGGRLILSGFTLRNADHLSQSFAAEVLESLASGNWRAVILRKR